MTEALRHNPDEFQPQPGDDPRTVRAIESGFALPQDIAEMRMLAGLAKFARKYPAAKRFDMQLTELSNEIIDTPNNLSKKIQELNI